MPERDGQTALMFMYRTSSSPARASALLIQSHELVELKKNLTSVDANIMESLEMMTGFDLVVLSSEPAALSMRPLNR